MSRALEKAEARRAEALDAYRNASTGYVNRRLVELQDATTEALKAGVKAIKRKAARTA